MNTSRPALQSGSATPRRLPVPSAGEHDRQRARVLASLLLRPRGDKPTRRRWA